VVADYPDFMPRLPRWLPLNPGCGCLLLIFIAFAVLLYYGDAR